jgi:hypothetical protein
MKPKPVSKAKLFTGIMYTDKKAYLSAVRELEKKLGEIESESAEYDFTAFTKYYVPEMGKKILKKFLVFKKLISRDNLADIKIFTNEVENKFAKKAKRKINLDPGYLTLHNLVLASAKDRAHKIYLKRGIYADLTLIFHKNTCEHFPHTFPDFKSEKVKEFFCNVRKEIKKN